LNAKTKVGVVLLSGGLDSAVVATYAKSLGYEVHAITFYYGQRSKEVENAKIIAKKLGIEHKIVNIPFKELAWYSALTSNLEIPKERNIEEIVTRGIPITYVPMRNTLFIVLAAAYLESLILHLIERENVEPSSIEARIFIAANYLDYSGYPDCRPEYYKKINELMKVASKIGTEYNVETKIETPLLYKTKKEIVELGIKLKAPLEWTWSCYEDGAIPCFECDSCLLRAKGFEEAGMKDPLIERLKAEGKL
jgi:7-cyano-7-deazaguanine synthase